MLPFEKDVLPVLYQFVTKRADLKRAADLSRDILLAIALYDEPVPYVLSSSALMTLPIALRGSAEAKHTERGSL